MGREFLVHKTLPEGLVEASTANKSSLEDGHTTGAVGVCEHVLVFVCTPVCDGQDD